MISAKDFYNDLPDGEQYVNCGMKLDTFLRINDSIKEEMYFTIRQKNDEFKGDEKHQSILKQISKSKRDLEKREFEINHNGKTSK